MVGTPIGDSGLNRWAGVVLEEPVSKLTGRRWLAAIKEMTAGDPIVRAMLFAVEMLIRRAEWRTEAADDSTEAVAEAEFIENCRHDMERPWEQTLASILSFLPYGYAVHEIVYKRRLGDSPDPAKRSAYDDGRIGWRRWALRPQDTLDRWEFDDAGTATAMVQWVSARGTTVTIPLDRCLHFTTGGWKDSPEGDSILRAAYDAWDKKKKIQWIEAVGIERDLAGIPEIGVPAVLMEPNATPEQKQIRMQYEEMARSLRRNGLEGLVMPRASDEHGKELYTFRLVASGGSRQIDTDKVIRRHNENILQTILADFILLGHGKVGTYSTAISKERVFADTIEAWLDTIADTVNKQGIVPLMRLNGVSPAIAPRLLPGDVEGVNPKEYAEALAKLVGANLVDASDAELRKHVADTLRLPSPPEPEEETEPAAPVTEEASAEEIEAEVGQLA